MRTHRPGRDGPGHPRGVPRAPATPDGHVTLSVVRAGCIKISRERGVEESWPSCSLLECAGFRLLVDLAHPGESPERLLAALEAKGLEPAQIHAVLFTHLHPDHIGHKDLFRHALFVFHRDERLRFYFKGDRTLELGGSALLELTPRAFSRPRASEEWPSLRNLDRQIYVRHFPGHTPGSLVVFACVGDRVHALAGDVVLSRDYHDREIAPGSSWRPALVTEQMRVVARRAHVIVPGHGTPFECRSPRVVIAHREAIDHSSGAPAPRSEIG
jgi:glyoxylase-like metal-dependent hydrolase (beta-lactamase superfamily II)